VVRSNCAFGSAGGAWPTKIKQRASKGKSMTSGRQELESFARESLMRGIPRAELEKALASAASTPDQVRDGLAAFADVVFPIPVQRNSSLYYIGAPNWAHGTGRGCFELKVTKTS
jgi:hypothetical protein